VHENVERIQKFLLGEKTGKKMGNKSEKIGIV
jgi:hypothetical protein